jgi:hypothetical protein
MDQHGRRILAVFYSQSGQTERMLDAFLSGVGAGGCQLQVERLDLKTILPPPNAYPLPWSLRSFVREARAALYPDEAVAPPIDFAPFDAIVIAYPVWYLSPATLVASWLRGLPPRALDGKPVITLSTSRKMWFRAQAAVADVVNALGGRVVSHLSLHDRHGNLTSMILTVYFFLTGRRQFDSRLLRRVFGDASYGISERTFAEFGAWLESARDECLDRFPSCFELHPGLVLCELVGYRVLRGLNYFGRAPTKERRILEGAYLCTLAAITVIAIAVMMPPTLLLGKLFPNMKWLREARQQVLSPMQPWAPG